MKIDALERGWKANIYEMRYLSEIDRAFFVRRKKQWYQINLYHLLTGIEFIKI